MRYGFNDIYNNSMYETGYVIYIAGPYPIFNNIVIDTVRERCKGSLEEIDKQALEEFVSEFATSKYEDNYRGLLSFDEFINVVKTPPVNGKWFCHVDYSYMTKKQKEALSRYYKKPLENGVLVVSIHEWKNYREIVKSKVISQHKNTHVIQLSFPNRSMLKTLVSNQFKERGVKVAEQAVELFIMRMSNAYDQYQDVIDNICNSMGNTGELSYSDMAIKMRGIENYVLDDFIAELTKPMNSKKVVKKRRIYKMLNALVSDSSAREVVNKLRYKIDDLIEMRIHINNGNIPVLVRYSVEKVKGRIGEDSRVYKLSDYAFKRYAYLASLTSLKDWYYMKLILSNVQQSWNEAQNMKALLALIHRHVISTDRLMNDIGVKNTLDENLVALNSVFYNPYIKRVDINK